VAPIELGRKINERAAAVKASDTRISVEEPIQSWVQSSGIKDSRGSKKRKVVKELRQRMRDKKRIRNGGATERSSGEIIRLNDGRSHREYNGMSGEGE
jgi:hypothetical protein